MKGFLHCYHEPTIGSSCNQCQIDIGNRHKAEAFNSIFNYMVEIGECDEDFNGDWQNIAKHIISNLKSK